MTDTNEAPLRRQEEQDWLVQVAQGGTAANAAMRSLFTRYQPRFQEHLRHRGLADAIAQEVLQVVWCDVARRAHTYDPKLGAPLYWLWGFVNIELSQVLGKLQKQRQVEVPMDEEWDDLAPRAAAGSGTQASAGLSTLPQTSARSPESDLMSEDFKRCVAQALARFRAEHPQAAWLLWLRHAEELDLEAVTLARGGSKGAAKVFLFGARKKFADFVRPCLALRLGS